MKTLDKFKLNGKVVVVTGGAGLMGKKHVEAVLEANGRPVVWDSNVEEGYEKGIVNIRCDITKKESIERAIKETWSCHSYDKISVLINNAANNPHIPHVVKDDKEATGLFETYGIESWEEDIAVGLTGSFLCSQVVGTHMAKNNGGVILNVSSDLGVIAPDQRIYSKDKKPVSYSVVKHGIIGLTKYLATYWADKNVRVNSISPGGIFVDQDEEFVKKLTDLIPMGRMADIDEYKAAVLFLITDASSYMTGSNLIIDGGRTCW